MSQKLKVAQDCTTWLEWTLLKCSCKQHLLVKGSCYGTCSLHRANWNSGYSYFCICLDIIIGRPCAYYYTVPSKNCLYCSVHFSVGSSSTAGEVQCEPGPSSHDSSLLLQTSGQVTAHWVYTEEGGHKISPQYMHTMMFTLLYEILFASKRKVTCKN